jgi:copper chaperone CopZ
MKTQQLEHPADEVRRRIEIPVLAGDADVMMVEQAVNALPGVASVTADIAKHRLMVQYDAAQSDYQAIIQALDSAGFPPSHCWSKQDQGKCVSVFHHT